MCKTSLKKRTVTKFKKSKKRSKYYGGMPIDIPDWVKIKDFRTMDDFKKQCAVDGCEHCRIEWMIEEINEFYEAVSHGNKDDIEDEAMGLIRTYQQFGNVSGVLELWKKVRNHVLEVFSTRDIFDSAFEKWHVKKRKKNQAIGVTSQQLIDISGLSL
jgi:hypothetical protein